MLGWHISVYPKPEDLEWEERRLPSGEVYSTVVVLDPREALWSWGATLGGLNWLDELVKLGRAKLLAENGGYPLIYETTLAEVTALMPAPPNLRHELREGHRSPAGLSPSHPVIIEAWDES